MEHREGIGPKMHFRRHNEICKLLISFEHVRHGRHQEGMEVTVHCTTLHDRRNDGAGILVVSVLLNGRAPATLETLRFDARDIRFASAGD
jgi:hypothetical protein